MVVANPASAYMVAITTSIPATSVADDTDLETALESAIDDVLRNAIAFSATFVTVLKAWVVEDRICILLLIGDSEGEEMMKKLSVEGTTDIKLPDHEEAISPVTIPGRAGRAGAGIPSARGNGRVVARPYQEIPPAHTDSGECCCALEGSPLRGRLGDGKPEHVQLTQDEGVQNPRNKEDRRASLGDRAGGSRESCRSAGRIRRGPEQQA